MEIFAYSWKTTDGLDEQPIRIYGIDPDGKNVCLRVDNFTPYVYVELPDEDLADAVVDLLRDDICKYEVMVKKHLYNFQGESHFLFCACTSTKNLRNIVYTLSKPVKVDGWQTPIKFKVHEESATPILQLVSLRDIPTAGWIKFSGELVEKDEQISYCDREYHVKWRGLKRGDRTDRVKPKIMAFDIEVNSEVENSMPCDRPGDAIFQISCVFEDRQILLIQGGTADIDDVEVRVYDSEEALLCAFLQLIKVEMPNVVTGYNILGFDMDYIIQRCSRFYLVDELKASGFTDIFPAEEETIKLGRGDESRFVDLEGIIFMDLLPIIKKDYKLDSYKLDNVANFFLNVGKDPVSIQDIWAAYRTGDMDMVGKYCVKDSQLCLDLFKHLHCWVGLSEMATVCNTSIFDLYARGQQLKIYAQVYKHCLRENIIVDSDGYTSTSDECYKGAFVFDPVPGYYNRVVPLDFSSLYPSLIIAYNICYSTIVGEDVPDEQCNTFEWEDHVDCEHDPKVVMYKELSSNINTLSVDAWWVRCGRTHLKQSGLAEVISDINAAIKPLRTQRKELKLHVPVKHVETPHHKLVQQIKRDVVKKYLECSIKITGTVDQLSALRDAITDDLVPLGKKSLTEKLKVQALIDERPQKRVPKELKTNCAHRRYRFYKSDVKKGVIPTIIQKLLDSRKATKAALKVATDPGEKIVLDKRQAAYKVSANSMYGAMGVKRGYLPFMPGAMCITYAGRSAIEKTAELVRTKWDGEIVYGDTDSNYVVFPNIKTVTETWDYAIKVADGISAEFPAPMKLEFENTIYERFFILSKKRYMYQEIDRDGVLDPRIGKKGVILARRDNSGFVRSVYEKTIGMIFDKRSNEDVRDYLLETINKLFNNSLDKSLYVITKAVSNYEGDELDGDSRLGRYKIAKALPTDEAERRKLLGDKTEREYYLDQCPAQVQLAEKIKRRGTMVCSGSRLEFVVLSVPGATTLGPRLEDYDYYKKRSRYLPIDKLYYLSSLINPIDQILNVCFDEPDFIASQYKIRRAYEQVRYKLMGIKIKLRQ